MADRCTVCARPDVAEIDAAIAGGEGKKAVARRFDIKNATFFRHLQHRAVESRGAAPDEAGGDETQVRPTPEDIAAYEQARPGLRHKPWGPPPKAEPDTIYVPEGAGGVGKGKLCATCTSPLRKDVERLLLEGRAPAAIAAALPGAPCHTSIRGHMRRCMPAAVVRARGDRDDERAAKVERRVEELLEETQGLLQKAHRLVEDAEGGDPCEACGRGAAPAEPRDRAATIRTAADVLRGVETKLELLAKLRGQLTMNITWQMIADSPYMRKMMEAQRRALRAFPEARAAVAAELEALEQDGA